MINMKMCFLLVLSLISFKKENMLNIMFWYLVMFL